MGAAHEMAEHRKAVAVFKHHDNRQLTTASSEQLDICMQECFDKEEVLHRLMKDANDSELQEKAAAVAAARGIPQHRAIHYLKDLFKLSLPAQHTSCASLCQKMGDMVKQARELCGCNSVVSFSQPPPVAMQLANIFVCVDTSTVPLFVSAP